MDYGARYRGFHSWGTSRKFLFYLVTGIVLARSGLGVLLLERERLPRFFAGDVACLLVLGVFIRFRIRSVRSASCSASTPWSLSCSWGCSSLKVWCFCWVDLRRTDTGREGPLPASCFLLLADEPFALFLWTTIKIDIPNRISRPTTVHTRLFYLHHSNRPNMASYIAWQILPSLFPIIWVTPALRAMRITTSKPATTKLSGVMKIQLPQ